MEILGIPQIPRISAIPIIGLIHFKRKNASNIKCLEELVGTFHCTWGDET